MRAPSLDATAVIAAPPGVVMEAFFDPDLLRAWWQVARSVTTPRPLGPYALEWVPTELRDEVLGRLGGVFRGTIVECRRGEGFLVADAVWLPPDGEPIGPMALHVTFRPEGEAKTLIRVMQTGYEESARWRRYYEVIDLGWQRALASLKSLLEK
ncbi:MAG TPA: SRPBCC domain-containing protein [Vicinamibacterales bacterium]|nr:SRPBCC domain-containing protein [Vicinamibacterales bacterium]